MAALQPAAAAAMVEAVGEVPTQQLSKAWCAGPRRDVQDEVPMQRCPQRCISSEVRDVSWRQGLCSCPPHVQLAQR